MAEKRDSPTPDSTNRPGALPARYQEVLYWKISGKPARLVAMNLVAIVLLILAGVVFFSLAANLGQLPRNLELTPAAFLLLLAATVLVFVLHELAHGISMRIFGARPQYGVIWKMMAFYATSPGFAFRRNQYAAVCLAPLVSLSLLVVLGMALLNGTEWVALLAFFGTVNASGAAGDVWIMTIVLRYPANAYVIDERDGMRVLLHAA